MPASIKHLTDKKLNLTSLLAKWQDGLYYTAAIVKCDKTNKKCLVCFEDGSEVWVYNKDIHLQLTLDQLNEDEDIVCCICDDGSSEAPNEIILCDVCQQGYHQKCHNPPVDSSKIDESDDTSDHKDWFCATCSYILNQSNRSKLGTSAQQQQPQQQRSQPQSQPQPQPQPKPQSQPQPKPQPQSQPPSKPQPQTQQVTQSPTKPKPIPTQVKQSQPVAQTSPVVKQSKQIPVTSITPSTAIKTTIGPVKTTTQPVQKPTPYYPLSNQARSVATSSTAALASMTASSALVVGSSAGRTKQDLVNQSNRSSQRRWQPQRSGNPVSIELSPPPVKHAVRKSSVNFSMPPIKQSALPTATRSVLPSTVTPAKVTQLIATSVAQPTSTVQPSPPQPSVIQCGKTISSTAPDVSKTIKQQQSVSPTVKTIAPARSVMYLDRTSYAPVTSSSSIIVSPVTASDQSSANSKAAPVSQSSNNHHTISVSNNSSNANNNTKSLDGLNKTPNQPSSSNDISKKTDSGKAIETVAVVSTNSKQ